MNAPMSSNHLVGLKYAEISIGDKAAFTSELTQQKVDMFAELTGDCNPVHVCHDFAGKTRFGGTIAHGMFTASLISTILGTRLPGPGCIFISVETKFVAPVMCGDTVVAMAEVIDKHDKGNRVVLRCTCHVADKMVLEGQAIVKVPDKL